MAQPNDVKSILEIGQGPDSGLPRRKEHKLKDKKKRPEKVNREVFALIGDVPQMAPTEPTQSLTQLVRKERNFKKAVDKWTWHGFDNPARQDHLVLHHWTKQKETDEPYPFARFNRKVEVIRYADQDEYDRATELLKKERVSGIAVNTDWTQEETDHLLDLCEQFSLRFIVIADRFGLQENLKPTDFQRKRDQKAESKQAKKDGPKFHDRTVDELKDRYYSFSRAVLSVRNLLDHPLVKRPIFNYEQEVKRKVNNEKLFMRTKEQHEKERMLVAELKKLDQKIKKEEKEEKTLRKLIYQDQPFAPQPQQQSNQQSATMANLDSALGEADQDGGAGFGGGRRDRGSGVFLRSQILQTILPTKKEHLQKKFEIILEDIGVEPHQLQATQKVTDLYQELVQEILRMFALENYIKKMKEELVTINEAKQEKKTYLEVGKKQISHFTQTVQQQYQQQQQQQQMAAQQQSSQQAPMSGPQQPPGVSQPPNIQPPMGPPPPGQAQIQPPQPAQLPPQAVVPAGGAPNQAPQVPVNIPTATGTLGRRKLPTRETAQATSEPPTQTAKPVAPFSQLPPGGQQTQQPPQAVPEQQSSASTHPAAGKTLSSHPQQPKSGRQAKAREAKGAAAAASEAHETSYSAEEEVKKSPAKAASEPMDESHDSSALQSESGAATGVGKRQKKPRNAAASASTVTATTSAASTAQAPPAGKALGKKAAQAAAQGSSQNTSVVAEIPPAEAPAPTVSARQSAAARKAAGGAGSANSSAGPKNKK